VRLAVGAVVRAARGVRVANESLMALEEWKAGEPALEVRFEPFPGEAHVWSAYLKWLTPEQLVEVRRRVPGLDLTPPSAAEEIEA
jgi:hypothetical protein